MKPITLFAGQQQLELLDWSIILDRVSRPCFFAHVRKKFVHDPFIDQNMILLELNALEKTIDFFNTLKTGFYDNLSGCSSEHERIGEVLRIDKGHVLDNFQLNLAAHFFEIHQRCSKTLTTGQIIFQECPSLQNINRHFLKPVRTFIDRDGTIHYEKHPQLSEITMQINGLDKNLRNRVQQILGEEPYASCIQFSQYDIINERYVLPVKSDRYTANLGPIIGRSKSGMTLLVEPYELRELSNKRMHLTAQRDEILNEIFIKLSQQLSLESNTFKIITEYVFKLDLLLAKAEYCLINSLCKPSLIEDFCLEITDFFHPLIFDPVTNSLKLSQDQNGLIISGPNTGGKTVTLKTLALCVAFMNAGLYVPASSAKIPLVQDLYYFSHDQQDLTQGLSSFSSEATQYINLTKDIKDHSFVFVDEIFNSTSSEEASALALSMLEYLHAHKNIKVFLSTHHQLLKTSLQSNESYISAHVGFDFQAKEPTYKIQFGSPGSSMALSIFENLCHENFNLKSISQKAQKILDVKHISYEKLLEKLSAQKTQLDKEVQEAHILRNQLQHQKKSSEGVLYLERQQLRETYKKDFEKLFKDAQNWLSELKEEFRKGDLNIKTIDKKISKQKNFYLPKVSAQIQERPDKVNEGLKPVQSTQDIALEQVLFCQLMSANVKVYQINHSKSKIQVVHRKLKAWVPIDSLYYPAHSPKNKAKTERIKIHVEKSTSGKLEIDVRGQRLSECESNIFLALDELLCGDIPYLNIIHGHGDGILKKFIRDHLAKNADDFTSEPAKEHDGSTLVKLKN